jgi:hypothetical protein
MDVRVEESSKDHVLAVWDRVIILFFRGRTSAGTVRRCEHLIDEHARRRREQVMLLTIVDVEAPLPALEVRTEIAGALHRLNGKLARSAVVFEGEGFRAASVRAVVAGVSLFARAAYPHRIFSRVGAAGRFLAGGADGLPPPHELIRAVSQARARQGSPPSFAPWLPTATPPPAFRPRQS